MGIRIELKVTGDDLNGEVPVRVTLFNDSYEPVAVFRNALIGPDLQDPSGRPRPESVEATFGEAEEPLTLQPFTFYGRERRLGGAGSGDATVTARYRDPVTGKEIVASHTIGGR